MCLIVVFQTISFNPKAVLPFNVSVVFIEIRGTDPLTTNRFVLYPCPQDNDFLSFGNMMDFIGRILDSQFAYTR